MSKKIKVKGRFYIFILVILALVIFIACKALLEDRVNSPSDKDKPAPSPQVNSPADPTPSPEPSPDLSENEESTKEPNLAELTKPYKVMADVTADASMRQGRTLNSDIIGEVKTGEKVQLMMDFGFKWYYVRKDDGQEGWVEAECLSIPEDTPSNKHRLTDEQLEAFVAQEGLDSDTPYLVWADLDRQLTYVFKKVEGQWKIHKQMPCASGKNDSPTLPGLFKIKDRGEWFYNENLGSGFSNWVRYEGVYLFHSVAKDRNGNVKDNTLGERASAGCIRLSEEDSKWFYNNIIEGTTVLVR